MFRRVDVPFDTGKWPKLAKRLEKRSSSIYPSYRYSKVHKMSSLLFFFGFFVLYGYHNGQNKQNMFTIFFVILMHVSTLLAFHQFYHHKHFQKCTRCQIYHIFGKFIFSCYMVIITAKSILLHVFRDKASKHCFVVPSILPSLSVEVVAEWYVYPLSSNALTQNKFLVN